MNKFYRIEIPDEYLTATQRVIVHESRFGVWREFLEDKSLTLHQLAGALRAVVGDAMPTESELGFALLRLVQEGLVGMTGTERRPTILFKRLHEKARIPQYAHETDAGADVYSVESAKIAPGQTVMINLGFAMEIEPGWEIQVRSRSGLAKKGLIVSNAPGTIDSGFRGECKVLLTNTTNTTMNGDCSSRSFDIFTIEPGTRIAQFVVKQAPQAIFREVETLSVSDRGEGGFGSTGIK